MFKCWKCGTEVSEGNIHHINGDSKNNNPTNKIRLCPPCHDLIEGICGVCDLQSECHNRKFRDCWRFEGNIPPLYFKPNKEDYAMKSNEISDIYDSGLRKRPWNDVYCLICGDELSEVGKPSSQKDYVCADCVQKLLANPAYRALNERKLGWNKQQKRK